MAVYNFFVHLLITQLLALLKLLYQFIAWFEEKVISCYNIGRNKNKKRFFTICACQSQIRLSALFVVDIVVESVP